MSRSFQKILLIKPSSAGDILHALPVARALRRAWPDSHIAWLVGAAFAELLEVEPSVDELIPFERTYFARIGRQWAPTRDFARFVLDLRRRQFDLVIDLQGLLRSGFLAWASGARRRIGYRHAREFAWVFYSHALVAPRKPIHAVELNLEALAALNVPVHETDLRPTLTADDHRVAQRILSECGVALDGPFIVMVVSTRWETKRWPPERFGRLAARLAGAYDMPSLLVGSRGERDVADAVESAAAAAGAAPGAIRNICGRTTLRQLAAIIERARLVVTADSMPMHMAAAFDRPLVALFGPTNPLRTGPYRRTSQVMRLDLACSPCYLRRARECPYALRCMQDLDVADVFAAAAARLNGTVRRRGQTAAGELSA